MRKLCVIGSGYVGLVTGACFADLGNSVTLVDIDEGKIETLQQGKMPIYEPGLSEMAQRNTVAGRMHFTTSYLEGLDQAEFVFICVGTPSGVDGEADLQYVRSAAETIAEAMTHPLVIINKSTVPVGTGRLDGRDHRAQTAEADGLRSCILPRVFARRFRHCRFHESRSHRAWIHQS